MTVQCVQTKNYNIGVSKNTDKTTTHIGVTNMDIVYIIRRFQAQIRNKKMKNKYKNISAFTLAEVLITIVIISLLALITLPILKGGVDSKVTDSQKKTFEQKLKENFHAMQSAGALSEGYDLTEDFINAMKKYMNISKSCKSNKLSECFAEKVITEEKEVKYNTKQMSTSKDISAGFTEESDLGGVVFADGTTAIIAHDPDCYIKDKYDSSIDATACIAMIYDVNGKNAPNIMGVDVFELNVNSFGLSFEIIGDVVGSSTFGCPDGNCWQGAVNYCASQGGNLPSKTQLQEIAEKVYENCTITRNNGEDYKNYDCSSVSLNNIPLWRKITGGSSSAWLWSGVPAGDYSARAFNENYSIYGNYGRTHNTINALCVK